MMKKALKVTFGAILAAGTVSTAQANMNDLFTHVGVQVTGTYTKPSNNGLSFGDVFVAFPLANGGGRFGNPVFVDTDFDFDWGAGLTYGFTEATSIYFNYDHFSDNAGDTANNVRNLGFAFPNAGGTNIAGGNVHHRVNEFELGASHKWAQGPRFCLDYRAQLEWDKYQRDFFETINATANVATNGNFAQRTTQSEFRGFGPGVGIYAHGKPLTNCPTVGVFAGGIVSALYGRNEYSAVANNQGGFIYGFFPDTSHSVVAKVDVKFGVDYTNEFAWDGCKVPFGLALGMRYMNAINVFKNGNTYVDPIGNPAGAAAAQSFTIDQGNANDFGRFGPYLQLSLGNFA